MSLIYAALTLQSASKPITRDNLNAVLNATGVQADQGEINALLSLLGTQPDAVREKEAAGETPALVKSGEAPAQAESGEAPNPDHHAFYVYAVAEGEPVSFATTGIDGAAVSAMAEGGLVAVVHKCRAQPYASQEKEVVGAWVLSHQAVVEEASRHYEAVLPMSFDTMVSGKDAAKAVDRVRGWLREEGDDLRRKIDRVRNREEYGIQVLWDMESATREVATTCPAAVQLNKKMEGKPEGTAYFYKQQLGKLVKEELEKRAKALFHEVFELARRHAVEVSVDELKKTEGNKRMVANLSCLVEKGRVEAMRAGFNDYCAGNGLTARVAGPLPPYSFV